MTTIFVHGYNFDIAGGDDPKTQYRFWRQFTPDDHIIPFKWQSTPAGGIPEAWMAGSWNTYHWAWREAIKAADRVRRILRDVDGRADLVCHSLGSRVVYDAIAREPRKVRRVLTLNGADSVSHARLCMEQAFRLGNGYVPDVLSVMTEADDVLHRLGRMFTPKWGKEHVVGYDGLKKPWPYGWHEYDAGQMADGEGYGDHDWTFRKIGFHPLWRDWLENGRLPARP